MRIALYRSQGIQEDTHTGRFGINQEGGHMPAEKEKDGHEEHAAAPKKKGKGMLIGIIAVVVIAVGAAGLFFLKGKSGAKAQGSHNAEAAAGSSDGHDASDKKSGSIFNLSLHRDLQDNSARVPNSR
jgi:uncharacterized protein HemX